MCGIVGRFNYLSDAPVSEAVLRSMTDQVQHRGPDGSGVYVQGAVGFGHRRLAIIDLSDAGRQPMSTADGRLWITFNGEIYNFQELRRRLETGGYVFRSNTDTEVILAAYEVHGTSCLEHLRGIFAFAIWNAQDRSLFIARDRIGKKPLYYLTDKDGVAFASEPKAFLADPSYEAKPNLNAISQFLTHQAVPAPFSAFAGVSKLNPGHFLLVRDRRVTVQRYWKLRYAEKRRITEPEASEQLLALLDDSVRLRMISDVPVGAFLSGGIDSATVVALMARNSSRPVKTFSIAFDEESLNEVTYARLVARRYATDHHELSVTPDIVRILPKLVWHFDEPFADPSAVPTFCLAELTRQHVTVALNGDGGDESFAGYTRYLRTVHETPYGRLPQPIRDGISDGLDLLPPRMPASSLIDRLRRFAERHRGTVYEQYATAAMTIRPALRQVLCTPEFLSAADAAAGPASASTLLEAFAEADAIELVDALLAVDVARYLPDVLLPKVDIATMAHGLEGRSPLLDHVVMEFAASLPATMKIRGDETKHILKRTVRPLLPEEIVTRSKRGFTVPIEQWFRRELKGYAREVLLSGAARQRGLFNAVEVERLLEEHATGARQWHNQIWALLMLELWFQEFMDRRPVTTTAGESRASFSYA